MTLDTRFWSKVDKNGPVSEFCPDLGPCWLWTASRNAKGYGNFNVRTCGGFTGRLAHRVSYEAHNGPVPVGMQCDHLCRNRACVNPAHMEAVTPRENTRRGITGVVVAIRQRSKTHCPQGHPYAGLNLYIQRGHRVCRTCQSERHKRRYREKRAA